jgi:hypothetical protein
MIKVFENFDFSRVGQMQSLLEAQGIATFVKNQFASSVMGEVPFVEVCPQLYILHETDLSRARQLLLLDQPDPERTQAWVCAGCGMEMEAQFGECWNCAAAVDL